MKTNLLCVAVAMALAIAPDLSKNLNYTKHQIETVHKTNNAFYRSKAAKNRNNEPTFKFIHRGEISAIAFSSNSQILACASCPPENSEWPPYQNKFGESSYSRGRGELRLWNTRTGRLIKQISLKTYASSLAFSPDGKILAGGLEEYLAPDLKALKALKALSPRSSLMLWEVSSGKMLRKFSNLQGTPTCFSPDGKLLATGEAGDISLFDTKTWKRKLHLKTGVGILSDVAFSPSSQKIAILSRNEGEQGDVPVYSTKTGRLLKTVGDGFQSGYSTRFHGPLIFLDENQLVCGEAIVNLLSHHDGGQPLFKSIHTNNIGLSPRPHTLVATLGVSDRIGIWNYRTHKLIFSLPIHKNLDNSNITFAPNGKFLALHDDDADKVVRIYKIPNH